MHKDIEKIPETFMTEVVRLMITTVLYMKMKSVNEERPTSSSSHISSDHIDHIITVHFPTLARHARTTLDTRK